KPFFFLFILLAFACKTIHDPTTQLEKIERQLEGLRDTAMRANNIPRSLTREGEIRWIRQPYDWTEGFWSGTCWMLYERTGDEKWKEAAIASQKLIEHHKTLTNDHDLGFIFNNSYGKAYRST